MILTDLQDGMKGLEIGNIGYILDTQRLNWQQNRLQIGNKPATFSYICPSMAKFDHPRRLLDLGFSKFPPVVIRENGLAPVTPVHDVIDRARI